MAPVSNERWQTRFAGKVTTAEEAVRKIVPGTGVFIGTAAGTPTLLVKAMAEAPHLHGNRTYSLHTMGPAPYAEPGMEEKFFHTAFFIGANVRKAVSDGRAAFMPVFLSEIPRLLKSGRTPIDTALISVSPPDRHGCVSLGVSVDVVRAAVDVARVVIAEVNPQMPRTHGDSFLHVDEIDLLVESEVPLAESRAEEMDEVTLAIGRHVAGLIDDGATLQMGIGKIPDAVLSQLFDRRDLGVHSEMFSDGVMKLAEAGVINGERKTLLPDKIVVSFIMGSRALYEWVHENPRIEMRPSEFTNDPFVIARNDNMVGINSALAIDLTGQVAADTLMGRFFSGIGGQVDFIRGSSRAKNGKAIIALPSTAKDGEVSRIQPVFESGAAVVTSRGDVHYVATEYGVADLWGRNVRDRALSLIEIAHPNHRAGLYEAAHKRGFV